MATMLSDFYPAYWRRWRQQPSDYWTRRMAPQPAPSSPNTEALRKMIGGALADPFQAGLFKEAFTKAGLPIYDLDTYRKFAAGEFTPEAGLVEKHWNALQGWAPGTPGAPDWQGLRTAIQAGISDPTRRTPYIQAWQQAGLPIPTLEQGQQFVGGQLFPLPADATRYYNAIKDLRLSGIPGAPAPGSAEPRETVIGPGGTGPGIGGWEIGRGAGGYPPGPYPPRPGYDPRRPPDHQIRPGELTPMPPGYKPKDWETDTFSTTNPGGREYNWDITKQYRGAMPTYGGGGRYNLGSIRAAGQGRRWY